MQVGVLAKLFKQVWIYRYSMGAVFAILGRIITTSNKIFIHKAAEAHDEVICLSLLKSTNLMRFIFS